jgi:uncharacterized protein YndB with AHSA1/START domain
MLGMPVCETDSRDGEKFKFEWDDGEDGGFAISGQYIKLTPDQLIEHIERMHIPDLTPDNHIVTTFASSGGYVVDAAHDVAGCGVTTANIRHGGRRRDGGVLRETG